MVASAHSIQAMTLMINGTYKNKLRQFAYRMHSRKLVGFSALNFLKHYIYPLTIRRKKVPYDPQKFFTSFYRLPLNEFSDRITISPTTSPLSACYHYNSVENSIITNFSSHDPVKGWRVLDVGSGAGHWINFYLNVFRAAVVHGVDISATCVDALTKQYEGKDNVHILLDDVSRLGFDLNRQFNLINAIGVIFHIVDDGLWEQTLGNFAKHLDKGGKIVIGGQFGYITQDVQFHGTDDFWSWEGRRGGSEPEVAYVNKRIRSLRLWKKTARRVGLQVNSVIRTTKERTIWTPENNILILGHRG